MVPSSAWTDTAGQLVLMVLTSGALLPFLIASALFLLVILTIQVWGDDR